MGIKVLPTDALIVVDVQNDFCSGGALAVPEGEAVIAPLNSIRPKFSVVVTTRDWHPANHCSFTAQGGPWPPHCVQGTPGAEYHPDLIVTEEDIEVLKATTPEVEQFSDFHGEPPLAAVLRQRGVNRVFVGGLATDYCVRATVLDARAEGFDATLLKDCVRAVDVHPGDGTRAILEMVDAGAVVALSTELE